MIEGSLNHGRLIPKGTVYDSKTNRGIKVYNGFTRLFAKTVKVKVDNETVYLGKASSFKNIYNIRAKDSKAAYKQFKNQKSTDIIAEIQAKFNELKPLSKEPSAPVNPIAPIEITPKTPFETLHKTLELATYEWNKQHDKPSPNEYPVLCEFQIMNY